MEWELATVVRAAPGRLIGLAHDGDVRLVWDQATLRLPAFDMPHLAALLDAWCLEEELPQLRRGYYRLTHGPDGSIQLWLNSAGLALSRTDLQVLRNLVVAAADELCMPLCQQPRAPFGLGYRPLTVTPRGGDRQN